MSTLSQRAWRTAALTLTTCLAAVAAHASPQVGVQVSVHQPGFHGRVVIGDQPPPRVIYQQPVIVHQSPVAVVQQPIYMSVPVSHHRNWASHCGRWRACGQPVYFVQPQVVHHVKHRGHHHGWGHEKREAWREWREDRREERRENRREWRHERHGHD